MQSINTDANKRFRSGYCAFGTWVTYGNFPICCIPFLVSQRFCVFQFVLNAIHSFSHSFEFCWLLLFRQMPSTVRAPNKFTRKSRSFCTFNCVSVDAHIHCLIIMIIFRYRCAFGGNTANTAHQRFRSHYSRCELIVSRGCALLFRKWLDWIVLGGDGAVRENRTSFIRIRGPCRRSHRLHSMNFQLLFPKHVYGLVNAHFGVTASTAANSIASNQKRVKSVACNVLKLGFGAARHNFCI